MLHPIIITILIFLARILDVSIGTIRIIFVSRGIRLLSTLLGFFEVLIWLIAITQIIQNLNNVVNYIAYAGGFAVGNFVGISIERRLSLGTLMIRVITKKDARELINFFKEQHLGVTSIDAQGAFGPVKIIYVILQRKNLERAMAQIKKFNPNAFYTIEDIKFAADRKTPIIVPQNRIFFNRIRGFFLQRK